MLSMSYHFAFLRSLRSHPAVSWVSVTSVLLCFPQPVSAGAGDAPIMTESAVLQSDDEKETTKKKRKSPDRKKKEGTLDKFEKEATEGKTEETSDATDDYETDYPWLEFAIEAAARAVVVGGQASWYRVRGSGFDPENPAYEPRELGARLLPFFRVDVRYQNLAADLQATNSRAELGYGPFAAQFDWTRYQEWNPRARLDLIQWHVLYRMAGGPYVEFDVGLGEMTIRGNNNRSGFSMSLPLHIQPVDYLGISFRPVWGWINGNQVSDYAVELSLGARFISVHGGYRWVSAGGVSLGGPVVGLAFHL